MNQAEITKAVEDALAEDPTLLIRGFLQQQIATYQEHIKFDNHQILLLKKELKELDTTRG